MEDVAYTGIADNMTTYTPGIDIEEIIKLIPPYAVILHNDDVNTMDHVVNSLLKSVPELTQGRATEVMMDAHTFGQALVIACPLEHAELYRDRLESCGLTATIEQA